jgi:CRP/FNR family transcriptional regulator/CRP/FNR family cyclic AMP-dependent transcriptional regulator
MGKGGDEVVFAVLVAGDTFGELALFDEAAERTADAQAMELTECLAVDRQAMLAFLEANPAAMRRLIAVMSRYVREMDEAVSEAMFCDIPGRVARRLLTLAESHGEETTQGIRIRLRLPQRALAGAVGASRENVNRALSRFASRGDILQERGFITIVRPGELRKRF